MEQWKTQGIIISQRTHGENNALLSIFTEEYGKHNGYLPRGLSTKNRALIEIGNLVSASWRGRTSDQLGTYSLELEENSAALIMHNQGRLLAMQSACALLDLTLGEREPHSNLYYGTLALLNALKTDVWGEAYVFWELALLKELGFGLDLSRCAGGGSSENLVYVSPKSAVAVSLEKGKPYEVSMLALPGFLVTKEDDDVYEALHDGCKLGAYFLQNRVLAHTNLRQLPEPRQALEEYFARKCAKPAA